MYEEFLDSLPQKEKEKLLALTNRIETYGMEIAIKMKWVGRLREGLFEIRAQYGSNITRAIYFHQVGNRYIITHGFSKKTQKTPAGEIERAKRIMAEFLEEVKNGENG